MRNFIVIVILLLLWTTPVKAQTASEVKAAQSLLNILGYNAGDVDGLMGRGTQEALMLFLKDQKLDATMPLGTDVLIEMVRAVSKSATNPISKQVTNAKPVVTHKIKTDVQYKDRSKKIHRNKARLFIQFKNNSSKTVTGVEHEFLIKNSFGKVLYRGKDQMEVRIRPHKVSSNNLYYFWEDNKYMHDEVYDRVTTSFSNGTAKVEVKIKRVVFSDGSIKTY